MLCCVEKDTVTNIFEKHSTSIFRVKQSTLFTLLDHDDRDMYDGNFHTYLIVNIAYHYRRPETSLSTMLASHLQQLAKHVSHKGTSTSIHRLSSTSCKTSDCNNHKKNRLVNFFSLVQPRPESEAKLCHIKSCCLDNSIHCPANCSPQE